MDPKTTQIFFGVVLIFVLTANLLHAQDPQATLSGTITDSSGQVVANAKVTVKNSSTGQSTEAQTDLAGLYTIPNLAAGEYEISAAADGIGAAIAKVTLTAASQQTLPLISRAEICAKSIGFSR